MSKVACHNIKLISEKKSVFGAPSLELHTVLKILQKADLLAQKTLCARSDKQLQDNNRAEPPQLEQQLAQAFDIQTHVMCKWHLNDKLVCYNNRWYIPSRFLVRKLLRQYHNNA